MSFRATCRHVSTRLASTSTETAVRPTSGTQTGAAVTIQNLSTPLQDAVKFAPISVDACHQQRTKKSKPTFKPLRRIWIRNGTHHCRVRTQITEPRMLMAPSAAGTTTILSTVATTTPRSSSPTRCAAPAGHAARLDMRSMIHLIL